MSLLHPYKSFWLILIITNCNYNLPVNNGNYIFTNLASQRLFLFFSLHPGHCAVWRFRRTSQIVKRCQCVMSCSIWTEKGAPGFLACLLCCRSRELLNNLGKLEAAKCNKISYVVQCYITEGPINLALLLHWMLTHICRNANHNRCKEEQIELFKNKLQEIVSEFFFFFSLYFS